MCNGGNNGDADDANIVDGVDGVLGVGTPVDDVVDPARSDPNEPVDALLKCDARDGEFNANVRPLPLTLPVPRVMVTGFNRDAVPWGRNATDLISIIVR